MKSCDLKDKSEEIAISVSSQFEDSADKLGIEVSAPSKKHQRTPTFDKETLVLKPAG